MRRPGEAARAETDSLKTPRINKGTFLGAVRERRLW